jgi:glutathione peroxidase
MKKGSMKTVIIVIPLLVVGVLLMKKKDMSYRQSILKTMYPLIMLPGKIFGSKNAIQINTAHTKPLMDFYSLQIELNDGSNLDLNQLKGKKVILVNTASDCGYTGQYAELEKLYQQQKEKLVIIGFPANDFKEQEKKDDAAIAAFCKINYGVTFFLAKKSQVIKGVDQNPVFNWLSNPNKNGWCNQEPKWNFCKYLVDENGVLTHFFAQSVSPLDPQVEEEIKIKIKN